MSIGLSKRADRMENIKNFIYICLQPSNATDFWELLPVQTSTCFCRVMYLTPVEFWIHSLKWRLGEQAGADWFHISWEIVIDSVVCFTGMNLEIQKWS